MRSISFAGTLAVHNKHQRLTWLSSTGAKRSGMGMSSPPTRRSEKVRTHSSCGFTTLMNRSPQSRTYRRGSEGIENCSASDRETWNSPPQQSEYLWWSWHLLAAGNSRWSASPCNAKPKVDWAASQDHVMHPAHETRGTDLTRRRQSISASCCFLIWPFLVRPRKPRE